MIPHNISDAKLQEKLLVMQKKGKDDFFFFCKNVLDFEKRGKLSKFHEDLADFLQDPASKRKLVLVPRGHLKSTFGEAYIVWRLIRDRNDTNLIVSSTTDQAKLFLRNIKWYFEHQMWVQMLYEQSVPAWLRPLRPGVKKRPKRRDDEKWGEYEVITGGRDREVAERDPSVRVRGLEKNVTGAHPNCILFDDAINEQWVRTVEMREKAKEQVQLAFSLLKPGGDIVIKGTYYSSQDLYVWLERLDMFDIFRHSAYKIEKSVHQVLFPQQFVMTDLELTQPGNEKKQSFETLRRVQGKTHFARQYMLEPLAEEDKPFKEADIRYFKGEMVNGYLEAKLYYMDSAGNFVILPEEFAGQLTTYLTFDPARSDAKTADESALACGSFSLDNKMFMHEVWGKQTESIRLRFLKIAEMRQKYNPKRFGVERHGNEWVNEAMALEADKQGAKKITFEQLSPMGGQNVGKTARIKTLQPWIEGHRFYVPIIEERPGELKLKPWVSSFLDQMFSFSPIEKGSSLKDKLDATAYLPQMHEIKARRTRKERRHSRRDTRRPYSSITGY